MRNIRVLGIFKKPSTSEASGIWSLEEQHNARRNDIWPLLGIPIPTYFNGINTVINGSTFIYEASAGNVGPSPCTTTPYPGLIFDLRGINVQSIDIIFDAAWYNSQPSISVFSGNYTVTNGTTTANFITTGSTTTVQSENLFTTFGSLATGTRTEITRNYTFGSGRTDLSFGFFITSCQAIDPRFLRIRSFRINGRSISSIVSNSYSTTSLW